MGAKAAVRQRYTGLISGLLLFTIVACKPAFEDDSTKSTVEPLLVTVAVTSVAQQPTPTPPPALRLTEIPAPPPLPTPEPTISITDPSTAEWQRIGGESDVLEIDAPSGWIDLSGRIDVSNATSPLGLTVLLLADSERSGSSILAGKQLTSGAFVVGLIANPDWPVGDPVNTLTQTVADFGVPDPASGQPTAVAYPISLSNSQPTLAADEITGAAIDIAGDLLGLFASGGNNLRNKVLLLPLDEIHQAADRSARALFLFTAPHEDWDRFEPIFTRMIDSIATYDVEDGYSINDGAVNIVGTIQDMEVVSGNLDKGENDVWAFSVDDAPYATLTLTPTDRDIDLIMTVFNPSGRIVARINSGYVGVTEVAADISLVEAGRYLVEVSEFSSASGRYLLDLATSESPAFGGQGIIEPGQGVQSELGQDARHVWKFLGTADQLVTIVLSPVDQFDAILHLYDPEGNRLIALDEGFSGDAEVISGFELPVTGEYSIHVRSFAGNGGLYTLSLDEGGEGIRNFFDAGDLADGDVKVGVLQANEAHAWFFEGRVGDIVTVEVVPLDERLDVDVWLLDPEIDRIAAEDRFAMGEAETIESMIDQDGQYLLFVRDFHGSAGAYEVIFTSAQSVVPADAGVLQFGRTVTATLSAGQTTVWRFLGNVDDVVDIVLMPLSAEADLLLSLQDPEENTLLRIDQGLAGQAETLSDYVITSDGQWRIVVKEFFSQASLYSLTVNRRQR